VNRRKKDGDQWVDEASFFDVTIMGRSAEAIHKFLVKGKQVGVQGELRQERWTQEGQQRSKVAIFGFSVQLLGDNKGGSQPQESHGESSDGDFEDDVPF
jgi:single-strand DNA-binding protein